MSISECCSVPRTPYEKELKHIGDSRQLIFYIKEESARKPRKESAGAAGWLLFSAVNKKIKTNSSEVIDTYVDVNLPGGTYGRLNNHVTLSCLNGVFVLDELISRQPEGKSTSIQINLYNSGKNGEVYITEGDCIAELTIEKIVDYDVKFITNPFLTYKELIS